MNRLVMIANALGLFTGQLIIAACTTGEYDRALWVGSASVLIYIALMQTMYYVVGRIVKRRE